MYQAWFLTAILCRCLLSQGRPVEPHSLRVCVVEPTQYYYSDVLKGFDAWKLAPELAKHQLQDGTSIIAIAVTGKTREEANAAAGRQRCLYKVELWRHHGVDNDELAGTTGAPSPTDQLPAIGDQDGIYFQLSGIEEHHILTKGFAPPPKRYGRSDRIFTPYPLFAKQIVTRLNKFDC